MKRKNQAGFTLVEMMVALAVLTVGLGAVALAVQTSIGWVKETRNRQMALHEARGHFEFLRDTGYNLLLPGNYSRGTDTNNLIPMTTTYAVSISAVNTNLKQLVLSTSWPSAFDPTTTNAIQFTTYISQPLHF